jgi:hypothetical protein
VKYVDHQKAPRIQQDQMPAHNDVPAIRWWRGETLFQVFGAGLDFLAQTGWKSAPGFELSFQAGRQTVTLGQARRQVVEAAMIVPLTGCVTIMVAVSVTVMITIPVPVIIIVAVVFVVALAVSLSLSLNQRC